MRFPILLFALVTVAVLPQSAVAQDFTFEVPVALTDLPPDITESSVVCAVTTREHGGTAIGWGSTEVVPISDGGYEGTVLVPVNATGDPSLVRAYNCRLILNRVEAGTLFNPPDRPGILPYDTPPGSQYSIIVFGVIAP